MADTTIARVKLIASHLRELSDEEIQIFIDDAKIEMKDYSLDDEVEEKAQRYLTAHLATINNRRAVSEEIKGELSVDYVKGSTSKEKGLESTKYGAKYKEVLQDNINTLPFALI